MMQDSSEYKLYAGFKGYLYPTQAFSRTTGKCPSKCWIDFLLYSFWRRHML